MIDKFRLQQGLLLTVRPDQPISLSIDQLRRLSWEDHASVWQDYVNTLAQCLVRERPTVVSGINNSNYTYYPAPGALGTHRAVLFSCE